MILMSKERAEKRLDFINKYRSYVINYNLGKDIVKDYVEAEGGTINNTENGGVFLKNYFQVPKLPQD